LIERYYYFLIPLILLTAGVAAPWFPEILRIYYVETLDFKLMVMTSLLTIILIVNYIIFLFRSSRNETKIYLPRSLLIAIVFFLFSFLSFLWANDTTLFLRKFSIYIDSILIFSIAFHFFKYKNSENILIVSLCMLALIVSVIGLMQTFYELPSNSILPAHTKMASTFGNKNGASQIFPLILPLFVYALIKFNSKISKLLIFLVLLISLTYVFYAQAKSVWLSIIFQSLIALFFFYRQANSIWKFRIRKLVLFVFLIFTLLIVLLAPKYIEYQDLDHKQQSSNPNIVFNAISSIYDRFNDPNAVRKHIWRSSISNGLDSPVFGHGLGNFMDSLLVEGRHKNLRRAHNFFVESFVEFGIIGLCLIFTVIYLFFREFRIVLASQKKSLNIYYFILISILGSIINMQFSWPFQVIVPSAILAILLAFIYRGLIDNNNFSVIILSKKFIILFGALCILLMGFLSFKNYLWNHNMSEFWINSGNEGHKYNYDNLVKFSNFPISVPLVYKIATAYSDAGYFDRASEILSITTDSKINPVHQLYLQYTYAKKTKDLSARSKARNQLLKNNKNAWQTFDIRMIELREKGDLENARTLYNNYKNIFLDKALLRFPEVFALLKWSISISMYEDTEKLYELFLKLRKKKTNVVEFQMLKYYTYTNKLKLGKEKYEFLFKNGFEVPSKFAEPYASKESDK